MSKPPVIVKEVISNRPAKGKAILGDIAGHGKIIPCDDLKPTLFHEGITYEYCGTTDGVGVYKSIGELWELKVEQTGRQTTGGDR